MSGGQGLLLIPYLSSVSRCFAAIVFSLQPVARDVVCESCGYHRGAGPSAASVLSGLGGGAAGVLGGDSAGLSGAAATLQAGLNPQLLQQIMQMQHLMQISPDFKQQVALLNQPNAMGGELSPPGSSSVIFS
jgi:hypothetical protein